LFFAIVVVVDNLNTHRSSTSSPPDDSWDGGRVCTDYWSVCTYYFDCALPYISIAHSLLFRLRPHQIVLFVLFEEEEDGDSQDDGESQGEDEGHRRTKKRKTDSKG
jgi:hypothetical protein